MKKFVVAWVLAFQALALAFAMPAAAQQSDANSVWVQVAARSTLTEAQREAEAYAARLPDVAGFNLGAGWYGIVIGPYSRADAERVLQVYRSEGSIPRDSFIAFPQNLRNQFYPVGNRQGADAPVIAPIAPAEPEVAAPVAPAVQTALPDETRAEARRSETLLSRDERKDLQIALKAAGFYTSTIDGAFGRGTRASMSDWQNSKGFEATGVLTTAQRKLLLDDYNAPLISVGMAQVTDARAGIALQIPAGEVSFARYESPFAHYNSAGDLGAQVLLISQPGDRSTLFGLFDIMQTLEIVPLTGERSRTSDSFILEGRNDKISSYTEAHLKNGEIKGFTLVWPTGDEARRARVLAAMQSSFTRLDGVLDAAAGGELDQSLDLVSGLEVRKPRLSRSGFFVTPQGAVLTTSDAVAGCTRITLDHGYEAQIAAADNSTGLALLTPVQDLAPMSVAGLANQSPRLQSSVAVSGFSYGGVLGAPSLTYGTLADVKGLDGDTRFARLDVAIQPGDVGGPVLDQTGAVLGLLLPSEMANKQLPEGVAFAATAETLRGLLETAGLQSGGEHVGNGKLANEALVREATGMTVLVSCWE